MARGGSRKHPSDCKCGNCPKMGRPKQERPVDGNLARQIKAKIDAEKLWLRIIEKEKWMMENANKTGPLKASLMYLDDRDFGKPAFAPPEEPEQLNVNLDASDRLIELFARAAKRSAQVHESGRARGSKPTD